MFLTHPLLEPIRALQARIQTAVIAACEQASLEQLAAVAEAVLAETAVWRIIVDPIDGTRGLMYPKRSGWILTAVAPNLGPNTSLQDIELAVQTEIPLVKQHLADAVWAAEPAHRARKPDGDTAVSRTPSRPTKPGPGQRLSCPLDMHTNVGWVGYANPRLQQQIEPLLQKALRHRPLLPDSQ